MQGTSRFYPLNQSQHFDTEYLGPNLIRSGGALYASAADEGAIRVRRRLAAQIRKESADNSAAT
jgi:hypothetical protein